MKVELLHSTPLWVCAKAIRKCWASEGKSDTMLDKQGKGYYLPTIGSEEDIQECGPKDKELIERIGNKNKHSSTLEHIVYTFDIGGISRACLQELARHRIASYSVKSTRYTLKELRDDTDISIEKYCVIKYLPEELYPILLSVLKNIKYALRDGNSNDVVKHMLPEAYKTSLVMTINARSLQNFLELRTSRAALWEIRELAYAMYEALPEEHKYLFSHCVDLTEGS